MFLISVKRSDSDDRLDEEEIVHKLDFRHLLKEEATQH